MRLPPTLLSALALIGALTASTLAAQAATQAMSPRAQRGQTFAQTNCARCHAIATVGESPLPIAPPFRTLHTRYPVENLAEALAEGIVTGHPSMPEFQLDGAQIDDLLAYLKWLER
ncbi:c-type cytochrome [Aquabacter cavernae]|uniref:c-type cytochrome n=1 Tax=Aquabacter cavernae TaxID=2496029 RepID=UPI000F8CC2AA|nr:cytochrome c [Aquabacter cavernae]